MEENETITSKAVPDTEKTAENSEVHDNSETSIEGKTKKRKRKTVFLIITAVFLVAAAVIAVVLFGKGGNKEKAYAQIAIEALDRNMHEMGAETPVFLKVCVKINDAPTDYTTEDLDTVIEYEEYWYYNIISRVYIEFIGQQESNGKTSITPMNCCVFIDSDGKTDIMYQLPDDSIKSTYRAQVQSTDYPEMILSLIVNDYHKMYDSYFPDETELPEWTELQVKSGQKDLSIDEILE